MEWVVMTKLVIFGRRHKCMIPKFLIIKGLPGDGTFYELYYDWAFLWKCLPAKTVINLFIYLFIYLFLIHLSLASLGSQKKS